jgi:hypothetical protein
MKFGTILPGLMGLVLMSVGAGRCPYGGAVAVPLSLVGCAASLFFALSGSGAQASPSQRAIRAALIVLGILIQLAGTISVATVVAGLYYARSHHTPFTGAAEVVVAGVCAVVAPGLLTFKGRSWAGWSWRQLGFWWCYWLAFYPLTMIAAAVSQPWGVAT